MDMLYISDLYKRFSDKKVLNGLNLSVPEHSIFGFIGKNGAGKTTTMKMVLGLLKADSGEIIVNGEKVVYGHLHGRYGRTEILHEKNGVEYIMTSCDKLGNRLYKIDENEE